MSIAKRLEALLEEIEKSVRKLGKKSSEITLIAVTKNASIEQMQEAYSLGLRHFGESRLNRGKQALFPGDVIWHFIGPLQSNKVKQTMDSFSYIHSIESLKIAKKISCFAYEQGWKYPCFIELNLSEEKTKHGFLQEEFLAFKEELFSLQGLSIQGIMTIAPHTREEAKIRRCFHSLALLKKSLPLDSQKLSMGMSEDFAIAIEEGATHIRIGSYLFQA